MPDAGDLSTNRFVEVVSAGLNGKFRYCRLAGSIPDEGITVLSPAAWDAAQELVESLKLQESDAPSVCIDPNGGMQLGWRSQDTEVEVYVENNGEVSFWYSGPALRDLVVGAISGDVNPVPSRLAAR